MDGSFDQRPGQSLEAISEPDPYILPEQKIVNMDREVYRIRMDLTSRECELKYSRAAEAHLRAQLRQIAEDNSALRQRLLHQEEQRIAEKKADEAQFKQSSSQIDHLRDTLRTEFSRTALLERQLGERTTQFSTAEKQVEESEKSRKSLTNHHSAHSVSQEALISALNEHTQKLLEDQLRLEADAAEASKEREEVQCVYVGELQKLQDNNAKLQSDLGEKDKQVADLGKQLRNVQGQLSQFSTTPNGQFKLISELYASLVTSEEKVTELEDASTLLKVQQEQSLQAVRDFSEELTELRNCATENTEALRKAEKLIIRLKRESARPDKRANSPQSGNLPESGTNTAAIRRELQMYRDQVEDEQKTRFFGLIAQDPERYEEVMAVARDQALLWAFVAEHGAEEHVRQVESLKRDIAVLRQAKKDLQTQNEHLSSSLQDAQQFCNTETERLRGQLEEGGKTIGSLTAQCHELDQNKKMLDAERRRFEEQLTEGESRLQEADKVRDNLSQELDKQKISFLHQSTEMSQLRLQLTDVTNQKDILFLKEETSRGEIEHLENVIANLTGKLPNADIVYWTSESARIRSELEGDRLLLRQVSTQLASLEELDHLKEENQRLGQRVVSLEAQVSSHSTTQRLASTDTKAACDKDSNRERFDLELQAHQAALASFADARAEVATLHLSLRQQKEQKEQWKKTVTFVKEQAASREKTWREEVRLLGEQVHNFQTWMDSTLRPPQAFHQQGSTLEHIVRHSALLQDRLKLAKEELDMVKALQDKEESVTAVTSQHSPESSSSSDVWQTMYEAKTRLLSSMVEYSATLRSEALTLNQNVTELQSQEEKMARQIEVLEKEVDKLARERDELMELTKKLEGQLAASIERFETGAHKAEVENLKRLNVEVERKRTIGLEKQKDHYRKQFDEIRKKNAETLSSKAQEIQTLKEQLDALQKVHSQCGETEQTLRDQVRHVEMQLAVKDKQCAQAVEDCNKCKVELAKALDEQSRLKAQVQSAQSKEKELRDELNSLAASGDSTDGAGASSSSRLKLRPVSSLLAAPARISSGPPPSTSIDASRNAPASVPLVQELSSQAIQSPMASPHPSMENVASMASTSSGLSSLPAAKRTRFPSTSEHAHTVDEADSQEPSKRARRDLSSDVISSTNSSLLQRPRTNSRSAGALDAPADSRPRADSRSAPKHEERQEVAQQPIQSPKVGTDGIAGDVQGEDVPVDMEQQPSPDDQMDVNDELDTERPDEGEDVEQEDLPLDEGPEAGQIAPADDDEAAEKDVEDLVTQSSEGAVSPSGELSDELSETTEQAEGRMYDVTPREDEESSSGSYDEDDGHPSQPTSSSFQFAPPAQGALHEAAEQVRTSEGGALQPEPSTSTGRLRPSLAPLDRPSPSQSPRSSGPGPSTAIPSSSLLGLPPRTPGVSILSGRYESGPDEYGVVPSTPKLITPRREDEANAMPHVPHFFGEMSEAIEDVTASQVPPTPRNIGGQFFEDASNAASEDSSSFQGPEDLAAPSLPSVSVELAGEGTDNVPTSQADEHPAASLSPRRATGRSQVPEPMVPSTGEASPASLDNDHLPSGSGLSLSPSTGRVGRRGRPPGPRAARAGRGVARDLRLSPSLLSSPERRPITAPVVASSAPPSDQVPLMLRSAASRGTARGTAAAGRSAATRGRRRRRSNLM